MSLSLSPFSNEITNGHVGGSWVTGSLMLNDFPLIHELVFGNEQKHLGGWLLDLDLATPDGINLFSDRNQHFFGSLLWSVLAKAKTGVYVFCVTSPLVLLSVCGIYVSLLVCIGTRV